jgi:hypothetical protein
VALTPVIRVTFLVWGAQERPLLAMLVQLSTNQGPEERVLRALLCSTAQEERQHVLVAMCHAVSVSEQPRPVLLAQSNTNPMEEEGASPVYL